MQVKRLIESVNSAYKKRKLLYKLSGGKCIVCGTRVIRTSTVQKYRSNIQCKGGCVYWDSPCGIRMRYKMFTIGHIIPRWKEGGNNSITNLRTECYFCNKKAAAVDMLEFKKREPGPCSCCGRYMIELKKSKCSRCRRGPIYNPTRIIIDYNTASTG